MNCDVLAALSSHSFYNEDILKYTTKILAFASPGDPLKIYLMMLLLQQLNKIEKKIKQLRYDLWGLLTWESRDSMDFNQISQTFLRGQKLTFHHPQEEPLPFSSFCQSLLSPPGMGWVGDGA